MAADSSSKETLQSEIEHILEESRMVLPGMQALFGFQLIVVFNKEFSEQLPLVAQWIHLSALLLVAVGIALIMAPAAYHRQAERNSVSHGFTDYASKLMTCAMIPLMLSIALEVGLVAFAISKTVLAAVPIAFAVFAWFAWLWFAIPRRVPHPAEDDRDHGQ